MIRIGIDGSMLLVPDKTGVERYTERLITELAALIKMERDVELHVYLHTGNRFADLTLMDIYRSMLNGLKVHEHNNPRGYLVYLSIRSLIDRLDLFHMPGPVTPRVNACPLLITCHDVNWARLPAEGRAIEGRQVETVSNRAIMRANAIIADSTSTRNDLIECFNKQDDEVEVVHLGVDPSFQPVSGQNDAARDRYGLERYILYVAAIQYRKNHVRLLRAFEKLVREHHIPHRLVLVGRDGWGSEQVYNEYERLGLGEKVRFLGYVPDGELPLLYSAADLVVYPSIYEGFGLPVLEAMACGAVLVIANSSSLPEVGGDAVIYCDPFQVEDIVYTILIGLNDQTLRWRLREAGLERAQLFSWKTTAQRTLAVYRKVASSGLKEAGG